MVGRVVTTVPTEKTRIPTSDGFELEAHVALPEGEDQLGRTGVLFVHGFPSGEVWAERIGADLPELADRAAEQMGWPSLAIRFRGCGTSTGDFSLNGWLDDVTYAIDFLHSQHGPDRIWVCGFGTGGAVALVAAATDPRIVGLAMIGSPADFDDWAANPGRLLAHAKRVGAIKTGSFPADVDDWTAQLGQIKAIDAAEKLPPRPLLVVHGSEDELVPHFDARLLADAHGSAELRFIHGGGHLLRHDPRAIAVLLGWLSRRITKVDESI